MLIEALIFIIPLCFLLLCGAIQYPHYWVYFFQEISPISFLHSTLLYSTSLLSGMKAFSYKKKGDPRFKYWAVLSLAFFYLTLDERFAFHERIRDRILSRLGGFLWMEKGDFVLPLFLVLGIFFAIYVYPKLNLNPAQKKWGALAFLFSVIAIGLDSLPIHAMSLSKARHFQIIEETFETLAMSGFMLLSRNLD